MPVFKVPDSYNTSELHHIFQWVASADKEIDNALRINVDDLQQTGTIKPFRGYLKGGFLPLFFSQFG